MQPQSVAVGVYRIRAMPDIRETIKRNVIAAARSSSGIAVQVTKEPAGGGTYRLVARVWCDNMFGCRPDALDALIDFNRTVGAA